MKTNKLRQLNKNTFKTNALKAGVLLALAGTMGYRAYQRHADQVAKDAQINNFQEELNNYKESITASGENNAQFDTNGMDQKKITISDKVPQIAVLYHKDGNISVMIDREYLSLEAAMEKYPEYTANLREYIKNTHQVSDINPDQSLER